LKESSDGGTLIAAGIYDSRFQEQQRRTQYVQNRFLSWALGRETDCRNAAIDWVDGKIRGCKGKQVVE